MTASLNKKPDALGRGECHRHPAGATTAGSHGGRVLDLECVCALPPAIRARDARAVRPVPSRSDGRPNFFLGSGLPRNLRARVLGRAFYRDGFADASRRTVRAFQISLRRKAWQLRATEGGANALPSVCVSSFRHDPNGGETDVQEVGCFSQERGAADALAS